MTDDLTMIEIDQFYPHPLQKVWRAMTTPHLMAQWLMEPVGFAPIRGHRFTMKGAPIPATNFSGDIACEVLDVVECERLQISWADANSATTSEWKVTWTLRPEGHGTRVLLQHSGFNPDDPIQQHARSIMGGGWPRVVQRLEDVLGLLENDASD